MTTWLVSRHAGAILWVEQKGIIVDRLISHLDPSQIKEGDIVIGTLPVNLAEQVCSRGGRFFNLSLDLPPEARGFELSADDLVRFSARLEEFIVKQGALL